MRDLRWDVHPVDAGSIEMMGAEDAEDAKIAE
jgi:hypothetical protein